MIIKDSFSIISGFFGILAALFFFIEAMHNKKTDNIKERFRRLWKFLGETRWYIIPETLITKFIDILNKVTFFSHKIMGYSIFKEKTIPFVVTINFVSLITALYFNYNIRISIIVACLIFPFCAMWLDDLVFNRKVPHNKFIRYTLYLPIFISNLIVLGLFPSYLIEPTLQIICLTSIFFWVKLIITYPIYSSTLLLLLIFPVFWTGLALGLFGSIAKLAPNMFVKARKIGVSFAIGISFSIVITLIALSIGHYYEPSKYVPQTPQMILVNMFFDGLTLIVTVFLLSWASQKYIIVRLPVAIAIDFFMASLLALLSLFFGLYLTDHAISAKQSMFIFIGKSSDGLTYEYGPLFWVMHSTFLPTIIFLSVLFIGWLLKLFLLPIKWIFGKAILNNNPLKLMGSFFALLATCFIFISKIL